MRNCDDILDLISASLDGALTTEEQTALDAHLASCPACSALYTELCTLHTATAELEELPAPAGFADAVMSAVAAEPAQEPCDNVIPFTAKQKARAPWTKWAVTAAAVAIVVLGAVSIPSLSGNMEVTRDTAAPAEAEAPEALIIHQTETADIADEAEVYYSTNGSFVKDGATDEKFAVSETATEDFDGSIAEPYDPAEPSCGQTLPQNAPLYDTADYCGTLTLTSDALPEGLEQYESTVDPDGTVTYVVPADYFFSVAQSFGEYNDSAAKAKSEAEYGLIFVEALP